MPNIATVFKAEIARLARKELRESSDGLKKAVAAHRAEISSLKRRVQALEAVVKRLAKAPGGSPARTRPAAPSEAANSDSTGLRFRASGMAANRKRLGLSAADFGLLVGATGQSIYAWEAGKAKPRPQALAAIAALRGIGKREVEARLENLKSR
jgi:DNA-binding transcriptional regulator YiaG